MAARDKEKYYWLKLDRYFFKRHDICIMEDMPEGKLLVLFYLKLMVEAIDHEGALRFSDSVPYTEAMLASVTKTDTEFVKQALQLFTELGIVEVLEDKTLYLREVAKLLDGETFAAKRQRELREKRNRVTMSPDCRPEIETDQESESESETEKKKESESEQEKESEKEFLTEPEGSVCRTKDVRRIQEAWNSLGLHQLVKILPDSKRGELLRARIREYGTEAVLEAIEKVRNSPFLKGQNNRSWVITFDWFVKPNNFVKVLEGNYDVNGRNAGVETSNPFLEMLMEDGDDR